MNLPLVTTCFKAVIILGLVVYLALNVTLRRYDNGKPVVRTVVQPVVKPIVTTAARPVRRPAVGRGHLFRSFSQLKHTSPQKDSPCDIFPTIGSSVNTGKNRACQRVAPSRHICGVTQKLFAKGKSSKCATRKPVEYCTLNSISDDGGKTIFCGSNPGCTGYEYGIVSVDSGDLIWRKAKTAIELQSELTGIVNSSTDSFGFCFIQCEKTKHAQLFLLPRKSLDPLQFYRKSTETKINVEIVLVDSLSRDHFYRSLEKTASAMRFINKRSVYRNAPIIFDFEMMQSVKARTYESLQALFTGHVTLDSGMKFKRDEDYYEPIRTEKLLDKCAERGYLTLWLDDLCWKSGWGPVKDFLPREKASIKGSRRWKRLLKAFESASISDIGLTAASCQILEQSNTDNPFHNLKEICFNNKYSHQYFFEYLKNYRVFATKSGRPYFSFYTCSTSHEETGVRVQTIDEDLAAYVHEAATLEYTVTVLLSDHGNNYGTYAENYTRGRYETYNPMLFFIIPPNVQRILGEQSIENMFDNQNKLVSMTDIHHTLRYLLHAQGSVSASQTLFGAVPETRTCDDIELSMPNVCICAGYELRVGHNVDHEILAEFTSGVLNNQIRSYFLDNGGKMSIDSAEYGSCRRIRPKSFRNMRKSINKNAMVYKFDLDILGADGRRETFFVAVRHGVDESSLTVASVERVTSYERYRQCAETYVNLRLCICTVTNGQFRRTPPERGQIEVNNKIGNTTCLFLYTRRFINGATFEIENVCNVTFELEFKLSSVNMDTWLVHNDSHNIHIHAFDKLFIGMAFQKIVHLSWSWFYTANLVK
ncbi:uncharacterized protein LOC141906285 [Tubulanus polymorphus]|uniref:uncharacterized protein LOC141906285 n=1 Tax=Tubulanus polymorphus TaxID=672921 RepID=UPI003DA34205